MNNELSTKKSSLRQRHSFWKSSFGSMKRLERVKQLSRPSHMVSSLSVCSSQCTNESVHDLDVAKQATVWRNLSHYWVFHWFLTPSFVLLGASAKSRRLRKLSHPSLLGRQVKTVMFISKTARFWPFFANSGRFLLWIGSNFMIWNPLWRPKNLT